MVDQRNPLAEELVAVANFATAWMRGGQPPPIDGWECRAWPGLFSGTVRDGAGEEVPWEDAEQFFVGRAGLWRLPADASGVVPGLWNKWADGPRRRAHPGGHYPFNTDLGVSSLANPRISLLLSTGPPTDPRARMWIGRSRDGAIESPFGSDGTLGPHFQQVPSIVDGLPRYKTDLPAPASLDRLARPGRHRAQSWQAAWGGQRWGGIVISARGYPDVRILQVAIHERWVAEDEVRRVLAESLRKTRFWGWSPESRAVIAAEDADALILSATDQLVEQVKRGYHVPAYPIGRSYLRLLIRKDLAALANGSSRTRFPLSLDELGDAEGDQQGDRATRPRGLPGPGTTSMLDGSRADPPEASPWSDRHLRRVTAQLAQKDGYRSLTLLTSEERRGYEAGAIEELSERHRLRVMRESIGNLLVERGVTVTREAIRQFVALHKGETPEELMRSASRYLERPRRRSAKPSP
jgi:hypothetical protein